MRTTGAMRGVGAAALLVLLVGAGCGDSGAKKKTEIRPVRTMVVDPKPIDDDRQAVGEVQARYESDLGFRVSGKVVARARRRRRLGQEGRRAGPARRAGLSQQAEIGGGRHRRRGGRARSRRRVPRGGCASCWPRARPRGPTTTPRSRTCARPRPSSTPPRPRAIWPRISWAMPSCVADFDGIVTAVGAEAGQVVNVGQMVVRLARPTEKDARVRHRRGCLPRPAERRTGRRSWSRCSAIPNIAADGVVREISPVADPATRTYPGEGDAEGPARADAVRRNASSAG